MHDHKPLHAKIGSKRHADGSFDTSDGALQHNIIEQYLAGLKSGKFKLLGGSEISLGDGKYVRTFIIDEGTG